MLETINQWSTVFLIALLMLATGAAIYIFFKKLEYTLARFAFFAISTFVGLSGLYFLSLLGNAALPPMIISALFNHYGIEMKLSTAAFTDTQALLGFAVLLLLVLLIMVLVRTWGGQKETKAVEKRDNTPSRGVIPSPSPNYYVPLPYTSNSKLFGRSNELRLLSNAWKNKKNHIVALIAWGGTGKTALLKHWIDKCINGEKDKPSKAFAYSFYSQGAAEDKQTDAEEFFVKALQHFGHQGAMPRSQHDKGVLLAQLVGEQRALLVLDGLEPLQHLQGVMRGELKDKGLVALLEQLAWQNQGLCLVSSRQSISELKGKSAVISHDLSQLALAGGIALLKYLGLDGSDKDFSEAVRWLDGHALALNLLGQYVLDTCNGDIRQRDKLNAFADVVEDGQHAEKIIRAYEQHLQGTPNLALLYLLGLFDRPVSQAALDMLAAPMLNPPKLAWFKHWFLRTDKQRQALTKPLRRLSKQEYGRLLRRLRQQHLLNQATPEHPDSLDCHPLLREYFSKRLQNQQPQVWQQAHRQLYEYYKAVPAKELPDTLEEMQPLFAAVTHGCAAGLHQLVIDEVYWPRIKRGFKHYSTQKLGAFANDLTVIAHFFSHRWHTPVTTLPDKYKAAILNLAAIRLRSLGRVKEAIKPIKIAYDLHLKQKDWWEVTKDLNSLCEFQLSLGAIVEALEVGKNSIVFADKSKNDFDRVVTRANLADIQQKRGMWLISKESFIEAESLQQQLQPKYPQLYAISSTAFTKYR